MNSCTFISGHPLSDKGLKVGDKIDIEGQLAPQNVQIDYKKASNMKEMTQMDHF